MSERQTNKNSFVWHESRYIFQEDMKKLPGYHDTQIFFRELLRAPRRHSFFLSLDHITLLRRLTYLLLNLKTAKVIKEEGRGGGRKGRG